MTRPRQSSLALIEGYQPAKGPHALVKLPQWRRLQALVREGVLPFADLKDRALLPYLRAMLLVSKWADDNGYDLSLRVVLSEKLLWAFLKHEPFGAIDYEAHLWRLALAHHRISTKAAERAAIPRPAYLKPYSDEELDALLQFASSLTNEHRRVTLLAIIVLGAGCGIVRSHSRNITATSLHRHGPDTFVSSGTHCAKVLPDYVELLLEVAAERVTSPFVRSQSKNISAYAVAWTRGHRGVPVLSVDRLRATYVVTLLDGDTNVVDLLAWTGVKKLDAFTGYLPYTKHTAIPCKKIRKVK